MNLLFIYKIMILWNFLILYWVFYIILGFFVIRNLIRFEKYYVGFFYFLDYFNVKLSNNIR